MHGHLHIPDLILKLYIVKKIFRRVISITTDKMVPCLARAILMRNEFEYNFLIIRRILTLLLKKNRGQLYSK